VDGTALIKKEIAVFAISFFIDKYDIMNYEKFEKAVKTQNRPLSSESSPVFRTVPCLV